MRWLVVLSMSLVSVGAALTSMLTSLNLPVVVLSVRGWYRMYQELMFNFVIVI